MTDDGVFNKFLELLSSLNDGKPASLWIILKKHHDEICLLKERIKVLEEQDHSTINAPSPPNVKRYVPRSKAQIAILECLSDGKKKTVDDFVGVSGTSRSNIYRVLRGKGTLKNPKGGLLVKEPRLKYSINYTHKFNQTPTYLFWLEDEIPSRLKTKPVKHPPIQLVETNPLSFLK